MSSSQNKPAMNQQEKYAYIVGLINTTLGGSLSCDTLGNYEIALKNYTRNFLTNILIHTSNNKKHLNISSKFRNENYFISQQTYKEIETLYVSITPGIEVAFLIMSEDRFQIIFINRDAKITSFNGQEKRKKQDNNSEQKKSQDKIKEIEKKYNHRNKRRIFVSL